MNIASVPPASGTSAELAVQAQVPNDTAPTVIFYGHDPGSQSLRAAPGFSGKAQFSVLADWWHEATDALSSPSRKVQHAAYRRIIDLGNQMVPFILADLSNRGGYWFAALEEITGASPVPDTAPPGMQAVIDAWLQWGRHHGLA